MAHTSGSLYNDPIWGHQRGNQQFGGGGGGDFGSGQFASKASFFANPYAQAGIQGGGAFLQALFGNREGKRHEKFRNEQIRKLLASLEGQVGSGPVISPQQIQSLTSQFREGQQPLLDRLGFQASRFTNLSSPEALRTTAQAQLPLITQFQGGLAQQNIGLTQQRDFDAQRLIASLLRT